MKEKSHSNATLQLQSENSGSLLSFDAYNCSIRLKKPHWKAFKLWLDIQLTSSCEGRKQSKCCIMKKSHLKIYISKVHERKTTKMQHKQYSFSVRNSNWWKQDWTFEHAVHSYAAIKAEFTPIWKIWFILIWKNSLKTVYAF